MFALQSERLFEREEDYRVLRNDWPYGLQEGVLHLCVWVKQRVPTVEGSGGKLTREARGAIDEFVRRTFSEKLRAWDEAAPAAGRESEKGKVADAEGKGEWTGGGSNTGGDGERVLWFKNWSALQSVRSIEHVHVLVRDPPPEVVRRWVGE